MATATNADATTTPPTPGESAEPGATDAAGMLDFYEPGALGMVRRFWPESSMVRYAARLAGRPRTVTRRAGAGRRTRRHRQGQLADCPAAA